MIPSASPAPAATSARRGDDYSHLPHAIATAEALQRRCEAMDSRHRDYQQVHEAWCRAQDRVTELQRHARRAQQ